MANVTFTVPNKNGSYDGDAVVKEYDSVTINAGDVVTVDQPCRGLVIFCKGDMTVNGTLHMNLKGAAANPTTAGGSDNNAVNANGLKFGFFDGASTDSLTVANTVFNGMGNDARTVLANLPSGTGTNYKVHTIPRTSATGASRPSVASNGTFENPGHIRGAEASSAGVCFGGGGAGGQAYETYNGQGGEGGDSTCFSGGSGGGGAAGGGAASSGHRGENANNYGGAGGDGGDHIESGQNGYNRPAGTGGAGNPGGTDGLGTGRANNAADGTGGLIVLIVGGNLTIGASGKIQANGGQGGDNSSTSNDNSSGGGGSGGGHILIACAGTVTANGSTIAAGDYTGNAGSIIGSANVWGEANYNLQAWGGRGGKSAWTGNSPQQHLYTGTTLTRQGGAGGRGRISVISIA